MKNLLIARALLATFVALFLLPLNGCVPLSESKPLLIVLGKDVSQTFEAHQAIDTTTLRLVCETVVQAHRSGTVAFRTIGNPSGAGFVTCQLKGLRPIEGTLSQRSKLQRENKAIARANSAAIAVFLAACQPAMNTTPTAETDLNGFLKLAANKLAQRNFKNYEKFLIINSDGLQDAGGETVLHQFKMPKDAKIYACGWKNEAETALHFENFISDINDVADIIRTEIHEREVADAQQMAGE
jgi:hypothetical protein